MTRRPLGRARGVTKSGLPIFSEGHEHIIVAEWLTRHGIMFMHAPNEGRRSWATGRKLKRMGMLKGVSDFLIFDPPPLVPLAVGAVLELKALDGANPTPAQLEFLAKMAARGHATTWCKGSEAAIKWLSEYCGYGKRRG